jgi:hypothetical protein
MLPHPTGLAGAAATCPRKRPFWFGFAAHGGVEANQMAMTGERLGSLVGPIDGRRRRKGST